MITSLTLAPTPYTNLGHVLQHYDVNQKAKRTLSLPALLLPTTAMIIDCGLPKGHRIIKPWLLVFVRVTESQRKADNLGCPSIAFGVTFKAIALILYVYAWWVAAAVQAAINFFIAIFRRDHSRRRYIPKDSHL